mmetsp:Transcript_13314/g.21760  ORF Transcript_13314/g.21760 Transcript_13314/m.21760 type:complete len:558 (-) Transcript_13314:1431-3104(-)|eukprot:CAMPEP_0203787442 /NCGR_PEP_ID=MMETSP0100_2-20121128/2235_1 /ASSEMBLY_ACC=CAM_ASM_000210 /TAXON_ID=96639 /ORGANISM=" , Strain NY0313808BC1" /LENGTH=557 /DNA_ID=CAMNT_0050689957 /DNA_START=194 /DNA_END=1867 /DNA_ORIENTATION=+
MNRIYALKGHIAANPCNGAAPRTPEERADENVRQILGMLEDRTNEPDRERVLKDLPGPMQFLGKEKALSRVNQDVAAGQLHTFWYNWSKKCGDGDPGTNIVFPTTIVPKGELPYIDALVVVTNPKDAQRLARAHVRKAKAYGIAFLGDGVLATRDIDSWKEQRAHLIESFLPEASLSKIFDVSVERARFAVCKKLFDMCDNGEASVNINEFLLHEAMAQLQLALMGETTEYMEETNVPLRQSFKSALKLGGDLAEAAATRSKARKIVHGYSNGLVARSKDKAGCPLHVGSSDAMKEPSKTPSGPLTARISDVCPAPGVEDPKVRRDNASTFLFAGHDTTANLMTHLIYHCVKQPQWQLKLQEEADLFFEKAKRNGKFDFHDLKELTVLKKCINETLRLSPSVPNGSFREIMFDETIEGPNGTKVTLKKGQPFVVPVWNLHHSEQLWGKDVWEFNPDREWLPNEEWNGRGLGGWNPESHRFCPFTFTPRDCMGKSFAQMEARVILTHLFHYYTFELAEPTRSKKDLSEISINIGTLGPKDGMFVHAIPRRDIQNNKHV